MESQDLFAVGRKKKRAPKPKSPHAKRIQEIMLHVYFPLYSARMHEKPLIQPRDWGLLRRLVDEYGPDIVEVRLREFFKMDDAWVREAGYSMGVFKSQWQKLAARALQSNQIQTRGGQPQDQCKHQPPCQSPIEHSRRLVADMRTGRPQSTPPIPSAFSRTTSSQSEPF